MVLSRMGGFYTGVIKSLGVVAIMLNHKYLIAKITRAMYFEKISETKSVGDINDEDSILFN